MRTDSAEPTLPMMTVHTRRSADYPKVATVVGAGLMGTQIGAEYALGGFRVTLVTRSASSATVAVQRARSAITLLADNGLVTREAADAASSRLRSSDDLEGSCADSAVIVESVREDLDQKQRVLRRAAHAAPEAVLATNTSSFPISALGSAAGCAERLIGTHYWNPPTLMPLVEVIAGQLTDPGVVEFTTQLLRDLGKQPVVVGDYPGFVWNRLQFALLREAAALVAAGIVDAATLDEIVRNGLGRRWSLIGPFETVELGGRTTFVDIARWLFPQLTATTDTTALEAVPVADKDRDELRRRRDSGLVKALQDRSRTGDKG